MIKQYTLHIINILIFTSCLNQDVKYNTEIGITHIDIKSEIKNIKPLRLSTIAKDIEYIKLETKDDNIINKIEKTMLHNNIILVSNEKKLMIFNCDGLFKRKVGEVGRGPGEYYEIEDFDINDKGIISIFDDELKKIILFDTLGNLLNEFKIDVYPRRIKLLDKSVLVASVYPEHYYSKGYTFCEYSFKGKIINKFFKRNIHAEGITAENAATIPTTNCVRFEVFNDTLTYWETHLNEVIKVYIPSKAYVKYYMDYPNFHFQKDMSDYRNTKNDMIRFADFLEVKDYIFVLKGIHNNEVVHVLYDKTTERINVFNFSSKNKSFMIEAGFYNDIDGGFPFLPEGVASSNELYCTFYPYELKNIMDDEIHGDQKFTNINKRKELEKLLEGTDLFDNPIIMIVKT